MTRLLTPTSILLTVILLAVNIPGLAVDRTFQIEVENSLKGTVPSNWWLHASWRDQTLVVFVSPPTQESFDLWRAKRKKCTSTAGRVSRWALLSISAFRPNSAYASFGYQKSG